MSNINNNLPYNSNENLVSHVMFNNDTIEKDVDNQEKTNIPIVVNPPECAVCFDIMLERISATSCGHVFHNKCLRLCIIENGCCPLCRNKDREIINLNLELKQIQTTNSNNSNNNASNNNTESNTSFVTIPLINKLQKANDIIKKQYSDKITEHKALQDKIEVASNNYHDIKRKLLHSDFKLGEEKEKNEKLNKKIADLEKLNSSLEKSNNELSKKAMCVETFFTATKYFENFDDKFDEFKRDIEVMNNDYDKTKITSYLFNLHNTISELRQNIKNLKERDLRLSGYALKRNRTSNLNSTRNNINHDDDIDMTGIDRKNRNEENRGFKKYTKTTNQKDITSYFKERSSTQKEESNHLDINSISSEVDDEVMIVDEYRVPPKKDVQDFIKLKSFNQIMTKEQKNNPNYYDFTNLSSIAEENPYSKIQNDFNLKKPNTTYNYKVRNNINNINDINNKGVSKSSSNSKSNSLLKSNSKSKSKSINNRTKRRINKINKYDLDLIDKVELITNYNKSNSFINNTQNKSKSKEKYIKSTNNNRIDKNNKIDFYSFIPRIDKMNSQEDEFDKRIGNKKRYLFDDALEKENADIIMNDLNKSSKNNIKLNPNIEENDEFRNKDFCNVNLNQTIDKVINKKNVGNKKKTTNDEILSLLDRFRKEKEVKNADESKFNTNPSNNISSLSDILKNSNNEVNNNSKKDRLFDKENPYKINYNTLNLKITPQDMKDKDSKRLFKYDIRNLGKK